MNRQDVLLAALAAADGRTFQPVHIQKTLFLIDRRVPGIFAPDSKYQFTPYDYGPFDSDVYGDLGTLEQAGNVQISRDELRGYKLYGATDAGRRQGEMVLEQMIPAQRDMVRKIVDLVLRLSFRDLVSAIYKAYPDMKANSVFR